MTVAELVEELKRMPQDALVVAEGYEDGYDTVKRVSLIAVEENPQPKWYLGKYVDSEKADSKHVVFINADNKSENK